MTAPDIPAKEVFAGVPNTARGEPTRIASDPTGTTDRIAYGAGRSAVVRSASNPLDAFVFAQHTGNVTSVVFSPDGKLVASADEAGYVRVWIPDHTKLQKHEFGISAAPIRDIAFAPDMKHMVIGSDSRGGYVKVMKYPGGSSAGTCAGHQKRAAAVDVRPVGTPTKIASGGEDMTCGLFLGPPVKETNVPIMLRHHKNFVNAVSFSPDGTKIASCSSDKTVAILDAESGELLKTIEGMFEGSTLGLYWNKQSTEVVAASADKTLRILDVVSGAVKSETKIGNTVNDMQTGCTWVHSSGDLVGVSLSGDLNVVEPGSDKPKAVLRGHSKTVVGVASVGSKMYSADYSGHLVAWEAGVGSSSVPFTGKGPVTACAIAANEKYVASLGQDGNVFITPTDTLVFGKPVLIKGGGVNLAVPASAESSGAVAAAMINESRMVVLGADGTVIAQKDFERSETGCAVCISADASLISYSIELRGGAGEIRFANLSNGTLSKAGETISTTSPANRMVMCPEAKVLVVGEKGRRIQMYQTVSGEVIEGGGMLHTARCDAVGMSADGKFAVTGGLDGSLAVWPVGVEGEPRKVTSAHRGGVTGAGFLDENTVISGGNDSTLRSWNLSV